MENSDVGPFRACNYIYREAFKRKSLKYFSTVPSGTFKPDLNLSLH